MESEAHSNWRLLHGSAFVVLMAGAMLIPELRRWPWMWIVPLAGYFLMAVFLPRWRSAMIWLRVGKLSGVSIAATVGIMTLTSATLVAFNTIAKPDVSNYR